MRIDNHRCHPERSEGPGRAGGTTGVPPCRPGPSLTLGMTLVVLLAVACGGEKQATAPAKAPAAHRTCPSAADAQAIIEKSSDFGELDFTQTAVTIPVKKSAMNEPQLDNAKQLAAAGWLKFDGDDVTLTKGKDDARFNVRGNGFIDVVPVAKKKMGPASKIRQSADGCDADFRWEWLPTEVGGAFKHGPVTGMFGKTHNSVATLMWDGGNWTMLRIK